MSNTLIAALDAGEFRDFPLKEVVRYNHNTAKFVFELPAGSASLLPVASAIYVKGPDDNDGKPVMRPYTPISAPHTPGELALVIKRYPDGKLSSHIHSMAVGQTLKIKGPIPKLAWLANQFSEVGMVAGGSGITPIFQVLQHSLAQQDETTKFKLIFGNVTPADILIRDELDDMAAASNGRFEVMHIISRPDDSWTGAKGRIDAKVIKNFLPGPELGSKVMVFVCGPPGQVAAVSGPKDGLAQGELGGALKDLGYIKEQVYKF
ncbi:NADH-cytochrome b5 reductase [Ceratobasidium sp. AG-I]|nr:NADH-cytochrome b5 reductase [Ceratobasidium sp. AG-I]